MLNFPCDSVEEFIRIFSETYLPSNARHWAITTKEHPSAYVLPNVSTPRLNKYSVANLSKDDKKKLEEFAKEYGITMVECLSFDRKRRIITCEDVKKTLKLFKVMYPSTDGVRHRLVHAEEDSKVVFQPRTSTVGLITFEVKNLSSEEETEIKEFAQEHQVTVVSCKTFEFDFE